MIRSKNAGRALFAAACAAVIAHQPALSVQAHTATDSWAPVELPPPPQPEPVSIVSAHSALLLLDFSIANCTQAKRPDCVLSIPYVHSLLEKARAHHMLIIYSAGPPASKTPTQAPAALARSADEPLVRAGVDKFFRSDLASILDKHHIRTVIITGTSAQGAVLYTATGAALRKLKVVVPVDGYSSEPPFASFAELYTAWQLKHVTPMIGRQVTLTRTDLISIR